MENMIAFVYSRGRVYYEENSVIFDGKRNTVRINASMSMVELRRKIGVKLKLSGNEFISSLVYRFPEDDGTKYISLDLNDDEDVSIMFEVCEQKGIMVEIYAHIDAVGSSGHVPHGSRNTILSKINENVLEGESIASEFVDKAVSFVEKCDANIGEEEFDHISPFPSSDDDDEGYIPEGSDTNSDVDSSSSSAMVATPLASSLPVSLQSGPTRGVRGTQQSPFYDSKPHYQYINWEHPDQEMDFPDLNEQYLWRAGDELYVGLQFESKQEVQMAIKHYAMRTHQTYETVESKPNLLYLKCPRYGEGCPWRVRAIKPKKSAKWVVTKWGGAHTCVNVELSQDHQKLDSSMVSSCILGMVNQDPSISISLIQEMIKTQYGYTISYKKAWKAKQKAMVRVFGDWDESYAMLPRWLDFMQLYSNGAVYKLDTVEYEIGHLVDRSRRIFHRLFWSFKQCADAFNYCKPIIQIDGTHLYGKYRHTLLIATTQDGNNCVLPIAFAVVEGETGEAWSWFLALIREYVTQKRDICLISDRHRSIKQAVENEALGWQPPYAYHVYCLRHIASNFNHRFKNQEQKKWLIKMGYTPCKHIFDEQLAKFREISEDVERWINGISLEKWSLAYNERGRRYGHMTTNLSEAVNKVLKGARNLPITALVKATYGRLVKYFDERGARARSELMTGARYSSKLMQAISKNQEEACSHQVRRYNLSKGSFEVEEAFNPITQRGGKKWRVVLSEQSCQCGKFSAYKYPCSHVIAVCAAFSIDLWQYVDRAYSLESIVNAYSGEWVPLGNEDVIPLNTAWKLVPDLDKQRAHGRPKSTRIRNEMDWVESQPRQRCRLCNTIGHNRRRCPRLSQPTHDDD